MRHALTLGLSVTLAILAACTTSPSAPPSPSATPSASHPATRPAKAERVTVTTAPAPVYYGRRLEPAAGMVIHGAGQSDPDQAEYVKACPTGRRPMVMMTYGGLRSWRNRRRPAIATAPATAAAASAPAATTTTAPAATAPVNESPLAWHKEWLARVERETGTFVIPQIGFGFAAKGEADAIASGQREKEIDAFCQELIRLGRPVFLRIGYEFNGEWNGYEPESYKKAFIKLVEGLRRNKCDKVAAVWCFAPEGMESDYMKYYPGDEYVDWWAADLFSPEHITGGLTKKFIEEAAARKFPVMIGESAPRWLGARQGDLSWRAWYARYFTLIKEHPNVKCFCLIVDDWARAYNRPSSPLHDWGDGRLWLDPYVWASWLDEMADPRYVHARSREETDRALNVGR